MSTGSNWHDAMLREIGAVRNQLDQWHEDLRRQCHEINEILDRWDAAPSDVSTDALDPPLQPFGQRS